MDQELQGKQQRLAGFGYRVVAAMLVPLIVERGIIEYLAIMPWIKPYEPVLKEVLNQRLIEKLDPSKTFSVDQILEVAAKEFAIVLTCAVLNAAVSDQDRDSFPQGFSAEETKELAKRFIRLADDLEEVRQANPRTILATVLRRVKKERPDLFLDDMDSPND